MFCNSRWYRFDTHNIPDKHLSSRRVADRRIKPQRPILLKGHERSITVVKFNFDGDLLFTGSKDHIPSVWRSENGERLGTFNGHKGTIWDLDCCRFSKRVITASADA